MSGAAALPGAELFPRNPTVLLEEATCPATSLPGAVFFEKFIFLKKQLVRGRCAAWGRTVSQECVLFWKKPLVWGSCAAWGRTSSRKSGFVEAYNVNNLNRMHFRISGTPVRRTRRQKYQKPHLQEVWDSCAQNRTSEISKNAPSRIMRLLCSGQTSEISKSGLPRIRGLLCARQNVRNLKT